MFTLLPYVPIEAWYIRAFDYPHLQLTIFTSAVLISYTFYANWRRISDDAFIVLLLACFIFQGYKILPYTSLWTYEVEESSSDAEEKISIYTVNVLQDNKNEAGIIKDTERFDADVVLFTETNAKWASALNKKFDKIYPYKVNVPKENTYGMLLFSKYAVENISVEYLVEDTIPSIHSQIVLPSKKRIQLYSIHPSPPTPMHNPSSHDRDAELIIIAKLTKASKYPVIVMGDFNDVAWSETSKLFQSNSGLLDLRKGRGLYNTYNAKNWFARWPLDHVFVSPDFRVSQIGLGGKVGSDHFAFYSELSLEPQLASSQKLPEPSQKDKENADEQIKEEKEQDKSED